MNRYAEYKGVQLTELNLSSLTAHLKRAISVMETKLGYSLNTTPNVVVAGTSKHGCDCATTAAELNPAPAISGSLRTAPFDKRLRHQRLDPFSTIHAVYIGKRTEDTGEIVILTKLSNWQPMIQANGFGNYIEGCESNPCAVLCGNTCNNCVVLLVDANWLTLDNLPDSLVYMLFDFMDWMDEGGYANSGITSESVDGHSVSYGEWNKRGYTPYDDAANQAILAQYVGAFGNPTRQYIH